MFNFWEVTHLDAE